tara:strand:+ start:429 stop:1799 length:1371 start_codon:yes stop_codon:yes gene_type:complete
MKTILTLLFYLVWAVSFSQTQLSQTTFDLGEISLLNSDIVDFEVKNISSESVFLLRIEGEQNVGSQYTSQTFNAGEKEGIRIKLNPDKKGKIERKVKLYFSNNSSPVEITVQAIVKDLPKNNRTACPQFGSALKPPTGKTQPVAKIQKFELLLYDNDSKEELSLLNETKKVKEEETVSFIPEAQNTVETKDIRKTVRQQRPNKEKKNPRDRRNAPSLGEILFGKIEDSTNVETEEIDAIIEEKSETLTEAQVNDEEASEVVKDTSPNNLLDQSYKPNNIVFLIDASTSMREEQKMDILKKAMIELLEPLRDIDYITIVTYSGEAKVVLPTSKGNLKTEIAQQIEDLKADGSTNAVKGIKKAIQVGKDNFLEDGNNQIFLASDGAFNIGENNMSLRKKIKKTANDGLTITVLGIKNDNWTNKSLKEIATLGDGDLIKIKSMRDASKVVQSMKRKALR